MRKFTHYLFILFLSFAVNSYGQNLVSNPDFESFTTCPVSLSNIAFSPGYNNFPTASGWINPVQNTSPDYFNACASPMSGAHVPDGIFGYQLPHSGMAYAGIIAFEGQYSGGSLIIDYREYLQTKLLQPLQAGRQYCVSFYLSPTIDQNNNFNYVALNDIGINLSGTQPLATSAYTLSLPLQISGTQGLYYTDTAIWYKVTGVFTAAGGEQWLTIGCFKNNGSIPSLQQVYPATANPSLPQRSYVYLDDISVFKLAATDTTRYVHDSTVCTKTSFSCTLQAPAAEAYMWSNGSTGQQLALTDTGNFWCVSRNGCHTQIDSFHIHSRKYVPLSLGKDTVNCQNQPVQLQAAAGYTTYSWNTGSSNPATTVTQSGSYILTVTDACGQQHDTVQVTIQAPTPAPIVHDTTVCQFTTGLQLNVSGTGLQWYHYPQELNAMTTQPPVITGTTGAQTLYVSSRIGGCESPRIPVTVHVRYKPKADIGDYVSLCEKDTTRIGKTYDDVAYAWSTGETTCCIHPDHTGPYTFSIYNDCGISTDSVFVDISPCDDCAVIPNVFTPNSDGKNDVFRILMTCPVTRYRLRIYNRWGQPAFDTNNPDEGWNGYTNGFPADKGVYVYMLEYESANTGRGHFKKGNLTLIK